MDWTETVIDLSDNNFYDEPERKSWNMERLRTSDCKGVIFRIGGIWASGMAFKDQDFDWAYNLLREETDLPIGCYYVFRPRITGLAQAAHLNTLMKGLTFELGAWWDVERNETKTKPDKFRGELWTAVQNLNGPSGIYTRGSFWNTNLNGDLGIDGRWRELPLWVARYSTGADHPWEGEPDYLQPQPWEDYKIWQWSADGNNRGQTYGVNSDDTDRNRWVNPFPGGDVLPPEPPPASETACFKSKVHLNMRSGPGLSYPVIGKWYPGQTFMGKLPLVEANGYPWTDVMCADGWCAVSSNLAEQL